MNDTDTLMLNVNNDAYINLIFSIYNYYTIIIDTQVYNIIMIKKYYIIDIFCY
jgi:hypothetical protein